MANNFSGNPITIDSAMGAAYPPGAGYMHIEDISWTDQGAAGDALVIKDRNGNLVLDTKASAQNVFERFGKMGNINGFQVTTLGSGKVMIYIK